MKENIINARVTFRKSPIHVLERFSFSDVDEAYSSFKKHAELRAVSYTHLTLPPIWSV